ncbi:metabolite traffic protein EboE [Corallincola spongiicola]|uniref:Sugar phosphate isomerase/epimerase n=1 Tax=Corallincola spongiicola TaxID=2520508 RepID=A0ABY1WSF1_9GAMM|nr:metabolite traffic protein EboE [Corallincola spongiicola]TAA47503.1 sugar phosphate isomerase/epimerase [Corallincola spongiicola]
MAERWRKQQIGYCSNVHPGESLAEVLRNITDFISPVREQRGLTEMEAGLWLSERAASELLSAPAHLKQWQLQLEKHAIQVRSLNGFPAGNFHQARVKELAYLPDWSDPARLEYSLKLAEILVASLPDNESYGTISTLPLGYEQDWTEKKQQQAAEQLIQLATALATLEQESGKQIRFCIEMEPGCALEYTSQLIAFYDTTLRQTAAQNQIPFALVKRHLGCCYDICHQAVMHEDIYASLDAIHRIGITIGKLQVSSALVANQPARADTRNDLQAFAEPKYMHQVATQVEQGCRRIDDLAALLDGSVALPSSNPWRIHFHVPLQATELISQRLTTTADQISHVCRFLEQHQDCRPHIEVETYTWQLLPEDQRPNSNDALITGICGELSWLEQQLSQWQLLSN